MNVNRQGGAAAAAAAAAAVALATSETTAVAEIMATAPVEARGCPGTSTSYLRPGMDLPTVTGGDEQLACWGRRGRGWFQDASPEGL